MLTGYSDGISGLGSVPITQTVGGAITGGLATAALATGGPTNPVGLALSIAAGAASVVTGLLGAFGVGVPDLKKIQATHVVDQLEPYLQQNLAWWQADSTPKTIANQQQAISIFNAVWQQVVQGCSDPSLGSAGTNCVGDRKRGGKWDWFRMYYDPIANTPTVDSGELLVGTSLTSGISLGPNLVIGLAAMLVGLGLISEG